MITLVFSLVGAIVNGFTGDLILFWFVAVIGLPTLWLEKKWPMRAKAVASAVFGILFAGFGVFSATPQGKAVRASTLWKEAQQKKHDALIRQVEDKVAAKERAKQKAADARRQAKQVADDARQEARQKAQKVQESQREPQEPMQSGQQTPADTPPAASAEHSPEFMLATIQNNGPVEQNDLLVRQFAAQLDALEPKVSDPRGEQAKRVALANMTLKLHDMLEEKGVDESYLSILTHVNAMIPVSSPLGKNDTAAVFATYYEFRIPH